MNSARKQKSINVVAAVLSVLFSLMFSTAFTCTASAAQQRSYGEKKVITTAEEALKTLKKHFEKRDVVIGEVAEKELYFEAEIKDLKNAVIDKVIIDKRTGRIRSIY
ncbi:MAG: hypothetical protein HZA15_13680 [Nitrospirae bacterium]|nr:hypothetical protein [Nitrospirota bacterium]